MQQSQNAFWTESRISPWCGFPKNPFYDLRLVFLAIVVQDPHRTLLYGKANRRVDRHIRRFRPPPLQPFFDHVSVGLRLDDVGLYHPVYGDGIGVGGAVVRAVTGHSPRLVPAPDHAPEIAIALRIEHFSGLPVAVFLGEQSSGAQRDKQEYNEKPSELRPSNHGSLLRRSYDLGYFDYTSPLTSPFETSWRDYLLETSTSPFFEFSKFFSTLRRSILHPVHMRTVGRL